MKFLLTLHNKTRYDANHFQGQQTIISKKEFLQVAGNIYDAVKENPNLISSLQLMNYNVKDGC